MARLQKPHILFIAGPTGVGKTDFAEGIAQRVPAEIVNMDLGQFYTPLTIGTAKPDWRSSAIPHHFFDIFDAPQNFTVVQYRNRLLTTVHEIWERGNLPLVVGGSTFYLKNIFFPLNAPEIRESVVRNYSWQELREIDPDRAAMIHEHDAYRINRAMALWLATGKKPSEQRLEYDPPSDYSLFFLTRDRHELYERIDQRVLAMIAQGWSEEVCRLRGSPWEDFLREKKIIGYNELLDYCITEDHNVLKEIIAQIQQRTRNYAKRQETFWRMMQRQLEHAQTAHFPDRHGDVASINLTLLDLDLYLSQLSQQLVKLFK